MDRKHVSLSVVGFIQISNLPPAILRWRAAEEAGEVPGEIGLIEIAEFDRRRYARGYRPPAGWIFWRRADEQD